MSDFLNIKHNLGDLTVPLTTKKHTPHTYHVKGYWTNKRTSLGNTVIPIYDHCPKYGHNKGPDSANKRFRGMYNISHLDHISEDEILDIQRKIKRWIYKRRNWDIVDLVQDSVNQDPLAFLHSQRRYYDTHSVADGTTILNEIGTKIWTQWTNYL